MKFLLSLAEELSIPVSDLVKLSLSSPFRYKVYEIPKRRGGVRVIAQPATEVKLVQKACVKWLDRYLPIHECATAYREKRGIKFNADKHSKNPYMLKMDFSEFFPSIVPRDLKKHIAKYGGQELDDAELQVLTRLLFWKKKGKNELVLSIGAPSSPFVSNTVMYDFDCLMKQVCDEKGVVYTRYADDITFSSTEKDSLNCIASSMTNYIERLDYPLLSINHGKTVFVSKRHQRRVTGLIINNEGKVSLGRERKRIISAMIHQYKFGKLDDESVRKLQGWIAFAYDVECEFVSRMSNKYGDEIVRTLLFQR